MLHSLTFYLLIDRISRKSSATAWPRSWSRDHSTRFHRFDLAASKCSCSGRPVSPSSLVSSSLWLENFCSPRNFLITAWEPDAPFSSFFPFCRFFPSVFSLFLLYRALAARAPFLVPRSLRFRSFVATSSNRDRAARVRVRRPLLVDLPRDRDRRGCESSCSRTVEKIEFRQGKNTIAWTWNDERCRSLSGDINVPEGMLLEFGRLIKCFFVDAATRALDCDFVQWRILFVELYALTRERTQLGIADFDEIWHECSFRKNIRPVFFFYRLTLKVGGMKHILLNISEIIEDIVFV